MSSYSGEDATHTLFLAFWGFIVYLPCLLSFLSFASFRYLVVERREVGYKQIHEFEQVVVEGEKEKEKEHVEKEEEKSTRKTMDFSISTSPVLAMGEKYDSPVGSPVISPLAIGGASA